jgi:hypothetical protein
MDRKNISKARIRNTLRRDWSSPRNDWYKCLLQIVIMCKGAQRFAIFFLAITRNGKVFMYIYVSSKMGKYENKKQNVNSY